jgi:hypothetical protein
MNPKVEIRSPKSEVRRKAEIRSPEAPYGECQEWSGYES